MKFEDMSSETLIKTLETGDYCIQDIIDLHRSYTLLKETVDEINQNEWNYLYEELCEAYYGGHSKVYYHPETLKNKNLDELQELYEEYKELISARQTYEEICHDEHYSHLFED